VSEFVTNLEFLSINNQVSMRELVDYRTERPLFKNNVMTEIYWTPDVEVKYTKVEI